MDNKNDLITTGERIGIVAKQKGINLHKLADLAGIPYNTLYSIVKRKSERVSLVMVVNIAQTLNLNFYEVLGDEDRMIFDLGMCFERENTAEVFKTISTEYEHSMISDFRWLNDEGQKAAAEYVHIMSQMEKYRLPHTRDWIKPEIVPSL